MVFIVHENFINVQYALIDIVLFSKGNTEASLAYILGAMVIRSTLVIGNRQSDNLLRDILQPLNDYFVSTFILIRFIL